jgi:hypothetical protein
MKPAAIVALLWACSVFASAQTPPDSNSKPVSPPSGSLEVDLRPSLTTGFKYNHQPQVRVDVLMVSLPQDKALAVLPALRDPERVSDAQAILLRMIGQKEATLIDWPEVTMHSGGRATCETFLEERYPTEFDQPPGPQSFSTYSKKKRTAAEEALRFLRLAGLLVPVTYEVRCTGVTLEVEAMVGKDHNSVILRLMSQYIWMGQMSRFETTTADLGKPAFVQQPVFHTRKTSPHLTMRNGERRLIYVGSPMEPGGKMELFILGATILPTPLGR